MSVTEKEVNFESEWDEVAPQLSIVIEGSFQIPTNVVPFDATSDVPIDEQKSEAMKNIQRKLRGGDLENAVGLLRAAREVWPENDCFGSNNMAPEEEFLALRDIFFADLGENELPSNPPDDVGAEDEIYDEEDEYADIEFTETGFKFTDFEKRLAHPKVVRACGKALENFEKNTTLTNHCIVKLLHRIAWDCKMHAMVFQASIFRTFQKIFQLKALPQFKELVKFATYIVRQFLKVAEKNPLVYMEVLCWKSSKEATDIEEGYGTYQQRSQAAMRSWTESEEEELKILFMRHQENNIEKDVVDWILENLCDNERTRRGVLKKLKEMYLLTDYKQTKSEGIRSLKPPKHWSIEEESQLTELFEQFKDAMDPLGCIMDRLDVRRPKNRIVEKLLIMGLVQDKKELRKKRSKKPLKSNGNPVSDNDSCTSESDSENDSTMPKTSSIQQTKRNKQSSTSKNTNKKKTTKKSIQVSSNELAKLLIEVVEADMSNALQWIKESIDDLVDDLENDPDDDEEGVPIVPIMESSITAMENEQFLKLLRAFGFHEPSDEQESYWRIPAEISVALLKHYCNIIELAVAKKLTITNEDVAKPNIEETDESSNENITEKLAGNENDDIENGISAPSTSETNDEINFTIQETVGKSIVKKRKKKILRMVDSDSENEAEKENFNVNSGNESEDNGNTENVKRNRTLSNSDDDEQRPKVKKTRVLESDEEI